MNAAPVVLPIRDPEQAAAMLNPTRCRILQMTRQPRSASEMAAELNVPRQRLNYHVQELHRAGLLEPAETIRKRNFLEQRYLATAYAYTLDPALLGPVAAYEAQVEDRFSGEYLLAATARTEGEVSRALRESGRQKKRLATLTIDSEFRFESAEQRAEFTDALQSALIDVIAKHTSPYQKKDGSAAAGRPYRLLVAAHPIPAKETKETTSSHG